MDRFDDFIDLEQVDYDYTKMRLFAQILSREDKRQFTGSVSVWSFKETKIWVSAEIL